MASHHLAGEGRVHLRIERREVGVQGVELGGRRGRIERGRDGAVAARTTRIPTNPRIASPITRTKRLALGRAMEGIYGTAAGPGSQNPGVAR